MNNKEKTKKNSLKTFNRLFKYIFSRYKAKLILVFICVIISSSASISVALSLKFIVDDYIVPLLSSQSPNFTSFYNALMVLATIFICGVISTFLYTRLIVTIGQGSLKSIRDDMFKHMQKLPISFFDKNANGEIMSLYTNDTDSLRQMINQSIPQLFNALFSILVTFITMTVLSPILTLFTFFMMGLMLFTTAKIGANGSKYFKKQQSDIAKITGFIEELTEGQKVIKIFNHENKVKKEFDELNQKLFNSASNAHGFVNMIGPVTGNIGNLQYVFVALIGGILLIFNIGALSLGVISSYLQLTKRFTQLINQIAQQFNSVIMALAGASRIFDLIDEEIELDEGTITLVNIVKDENGVITETKERTNLWAFKEILENEVKYTEIKGDVRFNNMTFGYTDEKDILKNITLYAKPGQKLAFVGATGAGKTTITNLINRFYDIKKGNIEYDGIDITKIKKSDLRKSLGIVLQDTHLFTGTIMENIRYGRLDATDEEVIEAAKLSYADHFINHLPDKYNTFITGDGEGLSQGQKQLLSIARAAVLNPPVLILDEATSNIDTRTEKIVQKGMDNLMKGRTVFVIAHRLSTIRNSNAIIVLDHGEIIERGDHKDLIEKGGIYYQLYTGNLELD